MHTPMIASPGRPCATTSRGTPLSESGIVVALAVLATLVVGLFAPSVAAASEHEARGIDAVCPAPDDAVAPEAVTTFPDVGEPHVAAVECAAAYGLVSGFTDGSYGPSQSVTRAHVATFVANWVRTATGLSLRAPDEEPFTDTADSVHAESIAALAEAGIVGGTGDGLYAPGRDVTRGQFAEIVTNAVSYVDVFQIDGPLPPPDDRELFTDVAGTTFEAEINALAGAGVVLGDADGAFDPAASVTRGQLATFLMRAADYADRHQRWQPTAEVAVLVAELAPVGDDGTGEAAGDDGATDADAQTAASGPTAVLTVNAFNGTLAYSLDVSGVGGTFGDAGAQIRVGADGATILTLADGTALNERDDGVLTGVVSEADASVRFADLAHSPDDAYVWLANDDVAGGALVGTLRLAS